jgi:hypothetical protein
VMIVVRGWAAGGKGHMRRTRLDSTLLYSAVFEEFIQSDPVLVRGSLISPLARSTCEARTPSIEAESCRLIAKLPGGCNADRASSSSPPQPQQQQLLTECLSTVIDAYVAHL